MFFVELTAGLLMLSSQFGEGTSSQSTLPATLPSNTFVSTASFVNIHKRDEIAKFIKEYFADAPVLAEIARCESTYRQVGESGAVIRGKVNPSDIGVMQINEYYHSKTAERLGINLHTLSGNVAYARYLYEKEGVSPWRSSAKCWKGTEAYQKHLEANS